MGIGSFAFAQVGQGQNCPTGYHETPANNNSHTGKIVYPSTCTNSNTTNNSGQNNWSGEASGKAGTVGVSGSLGGGFERKGETTSTSTQTQQCTPERTYYYNCEPDNNKKGKKN